MKEKTLIKKSLEKLRELFRGFGYEVIKTKSKRGILLKADLKNLFATKKGKLTIFDVGANIGEFTKEMLTFFPQSTFYAFEPIPKTFKVLKQRFILNSNIVCSELACGAKKGVATMQAVPLCGSNKIIKSEKNRSNTRQVKIVSLTEFCKKNNICQVDLLKTDVEGYDLQVLFGSEKLLKKKLISAVYCEVNLRNDSAHGNFFLIHKYLKKLGYEFYAMYDYSGAGLPIDESFTNALWIAHEKNLLSKPIQIKTN